MTSRCRITILDLHECGMSGQDAERLAGVLEQCPALSELHVNDNQIGAEGAGRLAGVLAQCPALSLLGLEGNHIGVEGCGCSDPVKLVISTHVSSLSLRDTVESLTGVTHLFKC